MNLQEQRKLTESLSNVVNIFKHSAGVIRPHFILTGPSGSGKSHIIQHLANQFKLDYLEINAAQLTKEGTSGNSLSKALSPIANAQDSLVICFVDEFDKLFISGNSNTSSAHESTNGVQNEFLRVLEADTTEIFADYGKYASISVDKVLFIFAGAFNGEENVTLDSLRKFGVKTEFLGRVGLVFNTKKLSLASLLEILNHSVVLDNYLNLYTDVVRDEVTTIIAAYIKSSYDNNTIGIRLINTLIHKYFINGGMLENTDIQQVAFQTSLQLNRTTTVTSSWAEHSDVGLGTTVTENQEGK